MSGFVRPVFRSRWRSTTRSSARSNGSGLSSAASTIAKSAVFAPIPSVSVRTVERAKAGSRRKMRSACRTSYVHMHITYECHEEEVLHGDQALVRRDRDGVPRYEATLAI